MMRNILIAWTMLAAVATLVLGIWISVAHLAVGVVMIASALMLLGLAIALVQEHSRRRHVAQPVRSAAVTTPVRQHEHKGRTAVRTAA